MNGGRMRIGWAIAVSTSILAGCVTMGRPLPEAPPPGNVGVRGPEIPLVPVPPPPLAQASSGALAATSQPGNPATIPGPPPAIIPGGAPTTIPTSVPPAPPMPAVMPGPIVPVSKNGNENPLTLLPPPTPVAAPAPGVGVTVRQLYETARERLSGIDSYIARMTRREMVKGEVNPEEILVFKYRKEPFSIYLKWLGKEGAGREAVYVKGRYDNKIHTLLAAGDIPFVPAGRRMALSPDNVLVRSATRHPITDAGMGYCVDRIGTVLAAQERGERRFGQLIVVGPVNRSEFSRPVMGIENTIPPGGDPSLPRGGQRTYYFDPDLGLPTLITTRDERGQEVEYYRYDRIQLGVRLDDADFDPDRLWAKPRDAAPATQ